MKLKVHSKTILADLHTPVGIFLKVRQLYHQALLLESSEYSSKENSLSFICFDSIDNFTLENESLEKEVNIVSKMDAFLNQFEIEQTEESKKYNGVFGFTTFDAIEYFEDLKLSTQKQRDDIPIIRYDLYRFIIVFDHFYDKLTIIENAPSDETSKIELAIQLLKSKNEQVFKFSPSGDQLSEMEDQTFMDGVTTCKQHCQRGDVFQIVPSRRFKQKFTGDEFNVYRALRSINPSPYLFYFDYSNYKIFGSSPEAQLIIQDNIAEIHPIAGTFKRTGDFTEDLKEAEKLQQDPKENAEHVMLVDLARNDLSRNLKDVKVKEYKSVQFFSHVIHLVSKLTAQLNPNTSAFQIFSDTFPAGTLSGAPKIKALQIIDTLEPHKRSYYGGGLGAIFFNGNLNHAIMIRSFLSKDNTLHYQAGAGIVIDSQEQKELNEVNNKLAALRKAISIAESNLV